MSEVISKVMPIILLTMVGLLIKRKNFFGEEVISGVKKLIINICLPSTLFLTFLNMRLERSYISLIFLMILLFYLLYLGGGIAGKIFRRGDTISQFFSTGFSFGLVGIPLFTIMFGEERMGLYSIMGLSHEIFIWFIYYPVLGMKLGGGSGGKDKLGELLRSPLNLSIILGVALNLSGINTHLMENTIFLGILNTLRYLGSVNAPLILICIGYGMNLDRSYMSESMRMTLIRLVTTFSVGYAFKYLILDRFVEVDPVLFADSFFSLIVLPPLLSLPLFLSRYGEERGEQLVSNATVQCTVVSLIVFVGYNLFRVA